MELLKLLSASEVFAQIVNFLILLTILRLCAWKPILGMLDKRRAFIAAELKAAEEAKTAAARLQTSYEARLGAIEAEARAKIQAAIYEGRREADELRRKAHQDAQDIIKLARENVTAQIADAREEMRTEIVDLAIKTTEQIIQERLTEDTDKKLVYDFLKRVEEVKR